jgi:hypothetical protein
VNFTQIAAGVASPNYADPGQSLRLPGTTGNVVLGQNGPGLSVTGDIDIRAWVAPDSWSPASPESLVTKFGGQGNRSYWLGLDPGGRVRMEWSPDGVNVLASDSTVAVGAIDGSTRWVRATLRVNNGAGGHDVKFYTSTDSVTWTQLGATVTSAGVTAISSSTYPAEVGAYGGSALPLTGNIYQAQILNGIGGAVVASPDFTTAAGTSFTDAQGNAWNVLGSGSAFQPGLAPSTPYTYRVRASNAGGDSPYSATASATTGA